MTQPDFDRMTKEEVIAWFDAANDLTPMLAGMSAASEPVNSTVSEVPMMLASIRLPVKMVEELDSLADLDGTRRSDVVRQALAAYIAQRSAPVARDEAEHALDVLRRVVLRIAPPPSGAAA